MLCRRSRCRGRCRSRSSYWRFAAGGGRSSVTMPDQSQRGRRPAMFHSSGLFVGGLCCLIHARPFSLAWRRSKQTRMSEHGNSMGPWKEKHTKCTNQQEKKRLLIHGQLHATCQRMLYQKLCLVNKDSPCAVPENVSTIEGVDWYILPYFARIVTKDRLPASEQHLVLQGHNMMPSI